MIVRLIDDSDLPAVLEVYRQCEDFLALGPNPTASMEMIAADRALSRTGAPRQGAEAASEYCGLFAEDGTLQGIFDFVRSGYAGDPGCAYIELLMIAAPYRGRGLGEEAVRWLEKELGGSDPHPQPPAPAPSGAPRVSGTRSGFSLAREKGEDKQKITVLRAGVQVNNPGAIRFWQRMGFAITSEAEAQADGTICYRLEKPL